QRIEKDIDLLHKNLVVLDGVLSHDVELNELPSVYRSKHRWLSNFFFNSSDALVKQVWESGYKCINYINVIENQISKINSINQREEKIALLKGLKSYAYLQLLNYYGNIVVAPITFSLDAKLSNTDRQSVIDYINEELDYAIEKLGVPLQNKKLNVTALKVLKARLALLEKKYEIAKNLTQEILSEGQYSLEQPQSIFTTGSKEIIWNNSDHMDANIKSYFYNRDFLPYIRLTEVYLMNAEANYRLANTIQAKASFDVVALRSGKTLAFSLENLQQLWLNEMSREGASFIALVRWGIAIEKLGQYGFTSPKNNLLPIPMFELALNRYLIQNQGY
ncbi:RagB/SusD family nutrient uptake outer membrane protein, partial [Pseudoxanthomonas sp. SGD-10]